MLSMAGHLPDGRYPSFLNPSTALSLYICVARSRCREAGTCYIGRKPFSVSLLKSISKPWMCFEWHRIALILQRCFVGLVPASSLLVRLDPRIGGGFLGASYARLPSFLGSFFLGALGCANRRHKGAIIQHNAHEHGAADNMESCTVQYVADRRELQ